MQIDSKIFVVLHYVPKVYTNTDSNLKHIVRLRVGLQCGLKEAKDAFERARDNMWTHPDSGEPICQGIKLRVTAEQYGRLTALTLKHESEDTLTVQDVMVTGTDVVDFTE
jgi:hypothetical protein